MIFRHLVHAGEAPVLRDDVARLDAMVAHLFFPSICWDGDETAPHLCAR